jgi:UDP-glucuronate decarboxylase
LPADDPVQRCPDISRAEAVLDWRPRVPLQDGLAKAIAYFDTLLKRGDVQTAAAAAK